MTQSSAAACSGHQGVANVLRGSATPARDEPPRELASVSPSNSFTCVFMPTVNQKRVVTFPASAAPLNVWSGDVSGLSQSNEIEHCPSFADQSGDQPATCAR